MANKGQGQDAYGRSASSSAQPQPRRQGAAGDNGGDEPTQPIMPNQAFASPDVRRPHDLYSDAEPDHTPGTLNSNSDFRRPGQMSQTNPNAFARLPPRSPNKYSNAPQGTAK